MTDQDINEAVAKKLGKGHIQDGWEKVCVIPDYCHSIEAASEIIGELGADDMCWEIRYRTPLYSCGIGDKHQRLVYEEALTMPMAICLAFLKLP